MDFKEAQQEAIAYADSMASSGDWEVWDQYYEQKLSELLEDRKVSWVSDLWIRNDCSIESPSLSSFSKNLTYLLLGRVKFLGNDIIVVCPIVKYRFAASFFGEDGYWVAHKPEGWRVPWLAFTKS